MDLMAKLVRVMWIPVLVVALYTGWIFWQRHPWWPWAEPANIARDPMAVYGKHVRILQFYARNREVAPGNKALLCYGVVNTREVRLDPPVEKMWPAVSRCFEVTPDKSTRYTLTAEGAEHTTVSQSVEIAVKP